MTPFGAICPAFKAKGLFEANHLKSGWFTCHLRRRLEKDSWRIWGGKDPSQFRMGPPNLISNDILGEAFLMDPADHPFFDHFLQAGHHFLFFGLQVLAQFLQVK
jgi:hypothetical protein